MGTTECRHIGMVIRFVFGLKVRACCVAFEVQLCV